MLPQAREHLQLEYSTISNPETLTADPVFKRSQCSFQAPWSAASSTTACPMLWDFNLPYRSPDAFALFPCIFGIPQYRRFKTQRLETPVRASYTPKMQASQAQKVLTLNPLYTPPMRCLLPSPARGRFGSEAMTRAPALNLKSDACPGHPYQNLASETLHPEVSKRYRALSWRLLSLM